MRSILVLEHEAEAVRATVVDQRARTVATATRHVAILRPADQWAEQDAVAVATEVFHAAVQALGEAGAQAGVVAAVSIANQRDTVLLWDRVTGRPVSPLLCTDDARAARECTALRNARHGATVERRSGLPLDPRHAGVRIAWMLDRSPALRRHAEAGRIAAGSIDSWLIWNLTGGTEHVTDLSNAARTMMYSLDKLDWDLRSPEIFGVPRPTLPRIVPSSIVVGPVTGRQAKWTTVAEPVRDALRSLLAELPEAVPIAGIATGRSATLFGLGCVAPGDAGAILEAGHGELQFNTGVALTASRTGNVTIPTAYMPPVHPKPHDPFGDEDGLYPVFEVETWDSVRGWVTTTETIILGDPPVLAPAAHYLFALEGTTDPTDASLADEACATRLASLASGMRNILRGMQGEAGMIATELRVTGPASRNDALVQALADAIDRPVIRIAGDDLAAIGAATLAGIAVELWSDAADVAKWLPIERRFRPSRRGPSDAGSAVPAAPIFQE